jgi:hypothetical protein
VYQIQGRLLENSQVSRGRKESIEGDVLLWEFCEITVKDETSQRLDITSGRNKESAATQKPLFM